MFKIILMGMSCIFLTVSAMDSLDNVCEVATLVAAAATRITGIDTVQSPENFAQNDNQTPPFTAVNTTRRTVIIHSPRATTEEGRELFSCLRYSNNGYDSVIVRANTAHEAAVHAHLRRPDGSTHIVSCQKSPAHKNS